MKTGVPKERAAGERRVALTPQGAADLLARGLSVLVEEGAGLAASFTDDGYLESGASLVPDGASASVVDVVLRVGPPRPEELDPIPPGSVLVGFLAPFADGPLVRRMVERGLTALAHEAMPRTMLAQSLDALSSQASAAGYAAAISAARASGRIFPMLTTAAGTVRPVKVLVLGAGVAGLQAIATCRRLGAVVSAYDIRPETRVEIESLGARFVEAPVVERSDPSGYAQEVAEDLGRRQREAIDARVAEADVVITAAYVPGKPAPLLITRAMMEGMHRGAVIMDLAAADGGNCELTRRGERIEHDGVIVEGPTDLPSRVAHDASRMYSRNMLALLDRLVRDGEVIEPMDDPILSGCCVVLRGDVVHAQVRALLDREGEPCPGS